MANEHRGEPDRRRKKPHRATRQDDGVSQLSFNQQPFMTEKVELLPPAGIHLHNRQLRRIPEKVKARWKRVIEKFGFLLPLLVNSNYELLHGEAAYLAALELNLTRVPVIRIDHLTREQQSTYRIWLNKAVESEEWDQEALAMELQAILASDVDIELTGFELPEIDLLLQFGFGDTDRSHLDEAPDIQSNQATPVQSGDIWFCGPHAVMCGDARDLSPLQEMLGDHKVRLVLTDPPYNIPIKGFVSGGGSHVHDEFVMGSKGMSEVEFQGLLKDALQVAQTLLIDGGLVFCFMDWRSIDVLTTMAKSLGLNHINTCVWKKTNGGMGGLYRSAHEFIAVFKCGSAPHVNNVQLGKYGRNRTNVWEYEGCNSINPARREELAEHPTPKPVAMLADAILDVTHRGELVFDPFLGSGSTMIAAHETGRIALGVELDPKYVDVSLRRWLAHTNEEPVHAETGLTYTQMTERGRPGEGPVRIEDALFTDDPEAV